MLSALRNPRPRSLGPEDPDVYFDDQVREGEEFWRRFGRRPESNGRAALEVGCGLGAMSLDIARRGATVLGVDLDTERVEFARRKLAQEYLDLADHVRFESEDLLAMNLTGEFDFVVSKDTFEHVADLPATLAAIFRALKPGGELWAGFSPLYYSPWGDHARTGLRLPWVHTVLPRAVVLKAASRHNGRVVDTLEAIGLNGLTPAGFRRMAQEAGFEIASISYNQGDKPLLSALSRARRLPPLERWATVSVYAVLRKAPAA